MTVLTPFRSGFTDVAVLQNRLNSIFHDFTKPEGATESLSAGNFVPAVDVYEDPQKLAIKLEVPGIPKEALDIRVEGRTLTIKGERTLAAEEKEENFHRLERRYGSFVRSFTLPNTVDVENVEASANDGVLCITLGKKPEAKPKQIEVKIGSAADTSRQDGPRQVEAKAA